MLGCPCHLIHIAAERGARCFSINIEDLLTKVYYYLDKSIKRKYTLNELQTLHDTAVRKVLKHISTRWLSLDTRDEPMNWSFSVRVFEADAPHVSRTLCRFQCEECDFSTDDFQLLSCENCLYVTDQLYKRANHVAMHVAVARSQIISKLVSLWLEGIEESTNDEALSILTGFSWHNGTSLYGVWLSRHNWSIARGTIFSNSKKIQTEKKSQSWIITNKSFSSDQKSPALLTTAYWVKWWFAVISTHI